MNKPQWMVDFEKDEADRDAREDTLVRTAWMIVALLAVVCVLIMLAMA